MERMTFLISSLVKLVDSLAASSLEIFLGITPLISSLVFWFPSTPFSEVKIFLKYFWN
jgi:hypothetical protein